MPTLFVDVGRRRRRRRRCPPNECCVVVALLCFCSSSDEEARQGDRLCRILFFALHLSAAEATRDEKEGETLNVLRASEMNVFFLRERAEEVPLSEFTFLLLLSPSFCLLSSVRLRTPERRAPASSRGTHVRTSRTLARLLRRSIDSSSSRLSSASAFSSSKQCRPSLALPPRPCAAPRPRFPLPPPPGPAAP